MEQKLKPNEVYCTVSPAESVTVANKRKSKLLFGFPIQTDRYSEHNKTDIFVIENTQKKTVSIADVIGPTDYNVISKRLEKEKKKGKDVDLLKENKKRD